MFSGNTLANIFGVELLFLFLSLRLLPTQQKSNLSGYTNNLFQIYFSNLVGLFVIDVAASGLDINQCDAGEGEIKSAGGIHSFRGTHKCHNTSTVSSVYDTIGTDWHLCIIIP